MMNFRVITKRLKELLGGSAADRFTVVGYRSQSDSAEMSRGNRRTVQIYYSTGNFPKGAGRYTASTTHRMTFAIALTVSSPSKVDLNIINSPTATVDQISSAMASMQNAAELADESFDELSELVYQILMDMNNFDLNLPKGYVADRWVDGIDKDAPQPNGSLVTLTGVLQYTCQTTEDIVGEVGIPADGTGSVSTQIDIVGDDVERTGVDMPIAPVYSTENAMLNVDLVNDLSNIE